MAFLTIASPAGGVLQGDRLDLRVRLGADARMRLDTQGATRLYRAPLVAAEMTTVLTLEAGAYLEYLPDPYIPYAGSRFRARTECVVAEDATLILAEVVTAGREAHGERHRFESFESRQLVSRPDGELVAADAVRLDRRETIAAPGRLGGYTVVGTLVVVHPGFGPENLRPALADMAGRPRLAGASSLPGDAGAWVRVLAGSAADAVDVLGAAFALARIAILGAGPPPTRRA
jgi:urease accessory protein